MREGFVGVHIGAGQHAESRTQLYLQICSDACKVAVDVLRKGGSALDAACEATMVLENAGETNAGYGSNLTESGTVEMGKFPDLFLTNGLQPLHSGFHLPYISY
jgi:taspase (threonine aspartase 1)